MILIVSTGVNRRDYRTESCRWISAQTVAPFYPKCAISQTMKSQGRPVLPHNAKQDLILISKKQFWYSCILDVFYDKGMEIPQIKFGFFLAFKQSVWPFFALFGFLLIFSCGNPEPAGLFEILSHRPAQTYSNKPRSLSLCEKKPAHA